MAKNFHLEQSQKFKECRNLIKGIFYDSANGRFTEIKKNDLPRVYMERHGVRIPAGMFRYQSAVEFVLETMSDIVELKRNGLGEECLTLCQTFDERATIATAASPGITAEELSQIRVTIPGTRQVQLVDHNMNVEYLPSEATTSPGCAKMKIPVEKKKTELEVVKERIRDIVAGSPNGLWADSLLSFYLCHYQCALPTEIQHIISDTDLFDTELFTPSTGEPRLIVYPKLQSGEQSSHNDSLAFQAYCKRQKMSVSWNDSMEDDVGFLEDTAVGADSFGLCNLEPDQLKLPSENELMKVLVSHVCSVSDICIQIRGSAYADILLELNKILGELKSMKLKEIVPGLVCFYFLQKSLDDGGNCCMRVRIIEKCSDDQVVVVFVDHGDIVLVPQSELYVLPAIYNRLPYQAVHCSLTGCEDVAESGSGGEAGWEEYIENLLAEELLGKTFNAHIDSRSPAISVTLWEENSTTSVNQKLMKKIQYSLVVRK